MTTTKAKSRNLAGSVSTHNRCCGTTEIIKGINPSNPNQAYVFFSVIGRYYAGLRDGVHPQQAMRELGQQLGFTVIASIPQSIVDGWDFWIEFSSPPKNLPGYIYDQKWKPAGTA